MLRIIRRLIRAVLRKSRIENDLNEELQFHLDMQMREYIRRGMTSEEARSAALRAFGGVQQIKEEVRDLRGVGMIEVFWQDLRFGLRTLMKSPGFSAVAVLTLALGIGANSAVFSVINGVVIRPLPYEGGDRIVLIQQNRPSAKLSTFLFSAHEVEDYRSQTQTLSHVVEYHSMSFILLGGKEPQRVQTGVVSHDFFDVLGVKPIAGRTFRQSDEEHGAEAVLMLSYGYWKRSFDGDPEVVGQVFQMNDRQHTVIGVLPPVPQYPDENDVYMPTSACPFRSAEDFIANRDARMMRTFGRIKKGVSLDRVQLDLAAIASRLEQDYPGSYPGTADYRAVAIPLDSELTRTIRPTLWMLLGTAGFVLLIVCASVANLMLARLLRREREMTVRLAMGASRTRILRQLITESTILSVSGGLLGLVFAFASLNMLVRFAARFTPRASEITIDTSVLMFTLIVSVLSGLIFGSLPALQSQQNIARSLGANGGRLSAGATRQRLRSALIVGQVAVSFVLLMGAGLMVRSVLKLQGVDPGIDIRNVLTMRVDLNFSKYVDPVRQSDFFRGLLADLKAIPGVTAAAAGGTFPLNERGPFISRLMIEKKPWPEGTMAPRVATQVASSAYFATVSMSMVSGRDFTTADDAAANGVAIVSQSLARRYWGTEDPIGQRISADMGTTWMTIVGIVMDVKHRLDSEALDSLYLPLLQSPTLSVQVLIRTTGDPMTYSGMVRDVVHKNDPEQPVDLFRTLEDVRSIALAPRRLTAALMGIFAGLALVITATGVAGVVAYSVTHRTREIGIRVALGARQWTVLWMVLRYGITLVAIGLAFGIAGSLALTHLMAELLFGITPTDVVTFVAVSAILLTIATLACVLPARRATVIDPVIALREA